MTTEFKLPELGENIEAGTVVKVLVSVGDTVQANQTVLELETDKAVLEVPTSVGGTVTAVKVKEGSTVRVGEVVLEVDSGARAAAPKQEEAPETKTEADEKPAPETPAPTPAKREAPKQQDQAEARVQIPAEAPVAARREAAEPEEEEPAIRSSRRSVLATPTVRRLAREIGVDIHQVQGSGPSGRIGIEDVKEFARQVNTETVGRRLAPAGAAVHAAPLPDFARWGAIETQEMSGVRRRTAEHMTHCWTTIPHVTQFDKADVTDLERLRKEYGPRVEKAGGKLTVTAFLIKVVAAALQRFPQFNCTIDVENQELIFKKYYNIGVAVDTDRGLLVPVLRDADKKNVTQLSAELAEMAQKARDRKLALDDMQGGTFTITNLGGIGGTAFTPIVNAPEVAILGVSRAQVEPVYKNGEFVPRTMLPLSLSYDHRVIDGADGARFLRWVAEAIEQPFLLFLEG